VRAPITISALTRADIAAVTEIERQGQLEPWTERSFIEELDRLHSYMLVARVDQNCPGIVNQPQYDCIAGYICYWCVADEIQILNIAVQEKFRGRAIGRALLSHAIRDGCERKARIATLEVRKSNIAARRLYEAMGFRIVGERPDYYEVQKEPAILMELTLSNRPAGC